ncbi:hypothetical protein M9H77_23749 [Catharanthus roseus]|uniref:Uncharacterized protein n=1 Tax=Catharanthus roseus TaxID=4058 RepID=A0ACC0AY91_CATRO|nr:hypothetical protein M9H77_23749 [Catharanthus roseus]
MHRSGAPYSVRGLHCTWLIPYTRASSDGMDDSDSGEWSHLKRGVDRRGCGPIGLRGHCIMLCGGVRPPSWSQGRPGRNHYSTHVDSLSVRAHVFPYHQATEVLGQELLNQISPEGHMLICFIFPRLELSCDSRVVSHCGTYNLVPRGTQMPYSAAVDLVAGLGVSHHSMIWLEFFPRSLATCESCFYYFE